MKFGQLIRNARKEHEYSQRELAELIGVDQAYLSRLENDRPCPHPTQKTIELIAEYLELSLETLKNHE